MANNIDLTISALECPLGTFQCSGRLFFRKEYTVLFSPKRTTSRFASLTLRTPHRSPVSLCFSPKRTTFRFASLSLRTLHRPIASLCFSPKRTTFRFASLSLRTPHRSPVSLCFSPKRTTSRFASLTLRLRTETFFQKVPVFRMAYSAIPHHRPYGRWCFARLIRQAETHELQLHSQPPSKRTALSPLKRSCFRFASLTLRTAHRSPVSSPLAAAAALWLPCVRGAVRRRAGLRGCLRIRGKGKGRRPSPVSAPNRLFKPLRCSGRLIRQAETHELQLHSQPPSKRTALSPLKRSCFSRFAASEPRTVLSFLLH